MIIVATVAFSPHPRLSFSIGGENYVFLPITLPNLITDVITAVEAEIFSSSMGSGLLWIDAKHQVEIRPPHGIVLLIVSDPLIVSPFV